MWWSSHSERILYARNWPPGGGPPRAFWRPRFYDFNLYTKGKKTEKLNYMHAHPVTRRLVQHPKEWPWSSWSFYAQGEPGLVRMDVVE
jgi:putative transposase